MNTIIIDGLAFSLPLFIMAVGGIYSEKSGVTNLALEGLQGFGAFVGALVAVLAAEKMSGSSALPFYLAMIFAMVGGLLFSLIHALLCIRFKADMVISGVVVNTLAMALTEFLTKQINASHFNAPSDKFVLGVCNKITIPGISKIPVLGAVFTNMYPFEFVIVVIAFIAWFVMYKTRFGLHLRACGRYAGRTHPADRSHVIRRAVRSWRYLLRVFDLRKFFTEHLCRIRLSRDRGIYLRKLEDPADAWRVSAFRTGAFRRLQVSPGTRNADQLSGSCHDPAVCAHTVFAYFLQQEEPRSARTWRDLRQGCPLGEKTVFEKDCIRVGSMVQF